MIIKIIRGIFEYFEDILMLPFFYTVIYIIIFSYPMALIKAYKNEEGFLYFILALTPIVNVAYVIDWWWTFLIMVYKLTLYFIFDIK